MMQDSIFGSAFEESAPALDAAPVVAAPPMLVRQKDHSVPLHSQREFRSNTGKRGYLVNSAKALGTFAKIALDKRKFTVDLETTSLDTLTCEVVGICLSVDFGDADQSKYVQKYGEKLVVDRHRSSPTRLSCYVPLIHEDPITPQMAPEDAFRELVPLFGDAGVLAVGFNLWFDVPIIERFVEAAGGKMRNAWHDVMLDDFIYRGDDDQYFDYTRKSKETAVYTRRLKDIVKGALGVDMTKFGDVAEDYNIRAVVVEKAAAYGLDDAFWTSELKDFYAALFVREETIHTLLFDYQHRANQLLYEASKEGLLIDEAQLEMCRRKYRAVAEVSLHGQPMLDEAGQPVVGADGKVARKPNTGLFPAVLLAAVNHWRDAGLTEADHALVRGAYLACRDRKDDGTLEPNFAKFENIVRFGLLPADKLGMLSASYQSQLPPATADVPPAVAFGRFYAGSDKATQTAIVKGLRAVLKGSEEVVTARNELFEKLAKAGILRVKYSFTQMDSARIAQMLEGGADEMGRMVAEVQASDVVVTIPQLMRFAAVWRRLEAAGELDARKLAGAIEDTTIVALGVAGLVGSPDGGPVMRKFEFGKGYMCDVMFLGELDVSSSFKQNLIVLDALGVDYCEFSDKAGDKLAKLGFGDGNKWDAERAFRVMGRQEKVDLLIDTQESFFSCGAPDAVRFATKYDILLDANDAERSAEAVKEGKPPIPPGTTRRLLGEYSRYVRATRLVNVTLSSIQGSVHPDGKIHTQFSKRTRTLRLRSTKDDSDRGMNFQNVSRDKDIRDVFTVASGSKIVEADYSQQELTIFALECGIDVWQKALEKKADLHSVTALLIFEKEIRFVLGIAEDVPIDVYAPPKAVLDGIKKGKAKMFRQLAKRINFGLLYGQTAFGLVNAITMEGEQVMPPEEKAAGFAAILANEEEQRQGSVPFAQKCIMLEEMQVKRANELIALYFSKMAGVKVACDKLAADVIVRQFVWTIGGRKIRMPEVFGVDWAHSKLHPSKKDKIVRTFMSLSRGYLKDAKKQFDGAKRELEAAGIRVPYAPYHLKEGAKLAINFLAQSSGSDMTQVAIVLVARRVEAIADGIRTGSLSERDRAVRDLCRDMSDDDFVKALRSCTMVAQVHDALYYKVKDEVVEAYRDIIEQEMVNSMSVLRAEADDAEKVARVAAFRGMECRLPVTQADYGAYLRADAEVGQTFGHKYGFDSFRMLLAAEKASGLPYRQVERLWFEWNEHGDSARFYESAANVLGREMTNEEANAVASSFSGDADAPAAAAPAPVAAAAAPEKAEREHEQPAEERKGEAKFYEVGELLNRPTIEDVRELLVNLKADEMLRVFASRVQAFPPEEDEALFREKKRTEQKIRSNMLPEARERLRTAYGAARVALAVNARREAFDLYVVDVGDGSRLSGVPRFWVDEYAGLPVRFCANLSFLYDARKLACLNALVNLGVYRLRAVSRELKQGARGMGEEFEIYYRKHPLDELGGHSAMLQLARRLGVKAMMGRLEGPEEWLNDDLRYLLSRMPRVDYMGKEVAGERALSLVDSECEALTGRKRADAKGEA